MSERGISELNPNTVAITPAMIEAGYEVVIDATGVSGDVLDASFSARDLAKKVYQAMAILRPDGSGRRASRKRRSKVLPKSHNTRKVR